MNIANLIYQIVATLFMILWLVNDEYKINSLGKRIESLENETSYLKKKTEDLYIIAKIKQGEL